MKFENTVVSNFQGAFRGLRNPLESWDRSDSVFGVDDVTNIDDDFIVANLYCERDNIDFNSDLFYVTEDTYASWLRKNGILKFHHGYSDCIEYAFIGPKDLDLAHRMIKAGTSDSKFLRQIFVSVDITAPLYWWKEFDTYKVGTVANSTSTMHKLASTPITKECFEELSYTDLKPASQEEESNMARAADNFIYYLESLRIKYLETKEKRYWKELIRWLPNGWLQTRTVTMNYTILRNQYFQRQHHKLSEWHKYCEWIKTLPYADDLITYTGNIDN